MKTAILEYEDKHEINDLNDLSKTIILLLFWIILCILFKNMEQ